MKINDYLNANTAVEVLNHEGLVLSAYLDSAKPPVWTWGAGLTNASGHNVERYKDNPQTLEFTLGVYVWALRRYAQEVLDAFEGYELKQHEFDGALSFHWNTGAIKRASWVTYFLGGKREAARASFLSWNKPKEIMGRRSDEARLFFDGEYSNDGKTTIYTRLTKNYVPVWSSAKRIETLSVFKRLLAPVEPVQEPVPIEMPAIVDTPEEPVSTPVVDYPVDVPATPAYSWLTSLKQWLRRLFAN